MTTIAVTDFVHRTPAFLHRIGEAIAAFFEGIDDARRLSQRFHSLARLSDAELAQRGLKRSDLPSYVLATVRS